MRETARQIKKLWAEKIQLSSARKNKDFGKYATECWKYYSGPDHSFLFSGPDAIALEEWALPIGSPRVTVNKCFEMVDVFLPYMHHRNPTRQMTNRRPVVPPELRLALYPPEVLQQAAMQFQQMAAQQMMAAGQQVNPAMLPQPDMATLAQMLIPPDPKAPILEIRKILMESVLNYTPNEFDLQLESRKSLTEALVTGRGVWWSEIIQGPHGALPGTTYCPVEHFFVDPDHNSMRHWTWTARERLATKYDFALRFGMDPKELKGGYDESTHQQATITIEGRKYERNADGQTHDLIRYWEIYSRCGIGHELQGAPEDLREKVSGLGRNIFLVITDAYDEPVNFRSDMLTAPGREAEAAQMMAAGLEWPVPFHKDPSHPWPFTLCDFHHQNDSPWPISHMRPALGCQKVIDWIWSHVAAKIRKSGQTKWLYKEDIDRDTLEKLSSLIDHEWIPVSLGVQERLQDVAYQMEVQPMNPNLFEVAQYHERIFEELTGVTALLAMGESGRQMRSSYEAQLKEKIIQSRPEAMADTYEETQSRVARNEAIMLRRLTAGEIAPFFQEPYNPAPDPTTGMPTVGENTQLWAQTVYSPNDDEIIAETDFRIEAGSMRKPNVGEALAGLNESANVVLPMLMQEYQASGNPQNVNIWLNEYSKRVLPSMPPIQLQPIQLQPQQPPKKENAA